MRFGMCNHKLRKGRYTLYLKLKKRDIPNTHISAEIYRIPDLKSPCIPYTQKPWPTPITTKIPLRKDKFRLQSNTLHAFQRDMP